jgi:hypothetical protein
MRFRDIAVGVFAVLLLVSLGGVTPEDFEDERMSSNYYGVSIPWYAYSLHGAQTWNRSDNGEGIFDKLEEYGVNCIQLNFARDLWEDEAATYRPRLRTIVEWCQARSIHVILKFQRWVHDENIMGMPRDKAQWIATCNSVLAYFAGYPALDGAYSLEIGNEPNWVDGDLVNWHTWSTDCVADLRGTYTVELIVPVDHGYGQEQYDSDPTKNRCIRFVQTPIPYDNIVYDMHTYAFWGRVSATDIADLNDFWIDQDFVELSQTQTVMLGEFGSMGSAAELYFLQNVINLAAGYDIGWIANHWASGEIALCLSNLETPNNRGQVIVDALGALPPPSEEPPIPPYPIEAYTVTVHAVAGGSTSPGAGTYTRLEGEQFSVTAYADVNYTFSYWQLGDYTFTTNATATVQGVANESYVLRPVFTSTVTLYQGVSSYPRLDNGSYNTSVIDDIINVMDQKGFNIYRMSIWYTVSDATRDAMIQHFLDNCAYDLIVCYHRYPIGSEDDWPTCKAWARDVATTFSAYEDRLWIEPVNERNNAVSNFITNVQDILDAIRGDGNTHRVVANKWTNHDWSDMASITDTEDRFFTGFHFYFDEGQWTTAEQQMQTALGLGLNLLNTEIGADSKEALEFSYSEVQRLNDFIEWCFNRSISNTVWQRYNLQNWDTYQNLGLTFPTLTVPPPPMPPPIPIESYTVSLLGATGGFTVPSAGLFTLLVGHAFAATAYAVADYALTQWLINGTDAGSTATVTVRGLSGANYTVQPVFTASPGEPAQEPPPSEVPPPTTPPPITDLPPAAAAISDAKRFTHLLHQLAAAQPPTLDAVWRQLQSAQPPTLEQMFRILERVS